MLLLLVLVDVVVSVVFRSTRQVPLPVDE